MHKISIQKRFWSLSPTMLLSLVTLVSLSLPSSYAWMTASPVSSTFRHSTSRLGYEDSEDSFAEHLPLSDSDLSRLAEMRSRHETMPIMILDAILPGQSLEFGSGDPKFHKLIAHVLEKKQEIGVIGLNPTTGLPLNIGVTLCLCDKNTRSDASGALVISATGQRRFEVQGEPWLDDTGSFYLADVEIVDDRVEPLSQDLQEQALELSEELPQLVEEWVEWVLRTKKENYDGMRKRLEQLGPMPDSLKERAIWVAALVNPLPSLKVCLEIRPAMLACKNDFDRMHLACAAIRSSIDHLSGKRRLF